MNIGETAYIAPWAIRFYSDGQHMVWGNSPIHMTPQGFSTIKIIRKENGFCVDVSQTDHVWEIMDPDELVITEIVT